jgi:DNA-binding MarR family transcriptional regulator
MKKTERSSKDTPRPPLKLGELHDNLGYLTRVARNVMVQSSSEFVGDLGFATGQITLLGLIAANKGVSQNDLARAILMRKSQVTGLIQDLVARGLVRREEAGADRRFNTLTLTPAGKQAWKGAAARLTAHSDTLLGPLEPAERAELTRLMRKMIAANISDIDFA